MKELQRGGTCEPWSKSGKAKQGRETHTFLEALLKPPRKLEQNGSRRRIASRIDGLLQLDH